MLSQIRLFLAILIAPLTPSLIIFFALGGFSFNAEIGWMLIFSLPFSYLSMILVGLPGYFFLKYFNKASILHLAIFGAIAGIIIFNLFVLFTKQLFSAESISNHFFSMMIGGFLGASTAIIYALIIGMPITNTRLK